MKEKNLHWDKFLFKDNLICLIAYIIFQSKSLCTYNKDALPIALFHVGKLGSGP